MNNSSDFMPFIKSNFLQTTSLVGERQFPRCIVGRDDNKDAYKIRNQGTGQLSDYQRGYLKEQGFIKGSIGASKAVQVIRPRIKKLGFYNWE